MTQQKSDVLIIGAGVIGLSCAYELSKQGAKVTVIDKGEPGFGCSYGNAGWITPCFSLPLPMPGMLMKSLKWLLDPMSPLHIKPEPNLLFVKWLMRFLRSMNTQTASQSIAALTELSKYSLKEYARLSQVSEMSFGFERKGLLMIGQSPEGMDLTLQEMRLVAEHGVPGRPLSEAEVRNLEPALTGRLMGGVYFPEEAHAEPLKVVQAFAAGATRNGVRILPSTEVFDFQSSQGRMQAVRTTRGWLEAEQFVLATGSWSNALGTQLKINLPILGGKGYALIIKPTEPAPKIPIMLVDKKVAITPRQDSVRLAGTLELVNQDYSINSRRVDAIVRGARECMNVPENPEILELWRGLRPCTPDGVPVIGFSKQYSNLLITTGHQMLGLQSAPGSARLATDLLMGTTPFLDPTVFRAERFT